MSLGKTSLSPNLPIIPVLSSLPPDAGKVYYGVWATVKMPYAKIVAPGAVFSINCLKGITVPPHLGIQVDSDPSLDARLMVRTTTFSPSEVNTSTGPLTVYNLTQTPVHLASGQILARMRFVELQRVLHIHEKGREATVLKGVQNNLWEGGFPELQAYLLEPMRQITQDPPAETVMMSPPISAGSSNPTTRSGGIVEGSAEDISRYHLEDVVQYKVHFTPKRTVEPVRVLDEGGFENNLRGINGGAKRENAQKMADHPGERFEYHPTGTQLQVSSRLLQDRYPDYRFIGMTVWVLYDPILKRTVTKIGYLLAPINLGKARNPTPTETEKDPETETDEDMCGMDSDPEIEALMRKVNP